MRRGMLINIVAFICILSETRYRPTATDAVTVEQRKEIENLRAELEEAFEEDEEIELDNHGIITQPDWTRNDKNPHNTKSKVVVTKTELDEVKSIRDEISKAVKNDEKNKKLNGTDMVGAATPTSAGPKKVQSSSSHNEPDIDIRKLQRLELSKRRTREVLILESIEEDLSFNLGQHVEEWEHIVHAGEEYFIGRLEEDLQIVHKNALHYERSEKVHIGSRITYLETYTFWNVEQRQQEGIIIVATGDQVLWYRADEDRGVIAQYWEWVVGMTISGLTHFTADGHDYLVVSSNQSSRTGYFALNIYQFNLKDKEFWITQRLQLEHPCGEVTFLDTGRDYVLAVPQNGTAVVYAFNPHTHGGTGYVHFELKAKYISEGIEYITAFQMGGRSYLALGGMQPQILLYQQGQFIPKTIFGNNFGLVEFFFPIPVRTYRDDLILLVQHRVDFTSHKLTVLETLIWDGEAFETTVPAPCKLGSQVVYGVNCMLDIQRDAGLKGAALLRRGGEVSVIVPRHETESGLFRLHTKLLAKNSELTDLQDIFKFLKEWVAEQDALIAQAQSFLNRTNTDGLRVLKTPELIYDGPLNELYVNDYKWTDGDSAADLNDVMNEIEKLEHDLSLSRYKRNADESVGHTASFDDLNYDYVEAEFLEVENVNGEPFYIRNGILDFDGILNVVDLEVLESEQIEEGRQGMLEELVVEENLEFEQINCMPWHEIADNLVFLNRPVELEELIVNGDVTFEDQLEISQLNSLRFPEDYLWTEGTQNPIINAKKTFLGTLEANHVDTEGTINGKDPLDIITLSYQQDWNGLPTFAQLEVSELFELNGTAKGRGLEDFPLNPTLEETKVIDANCEFFNLKVMGSVKIENDFNGEPLSDILLDIVQRPENPNDEILIPSKKTFTNVEFPIDFHVKDEKISGITIDQFIPRHSQQELSMKNIEGYVYFANLTLTGSYDGVLIEELMRDAIRIDVPANNTRTQLNFVGSIEAEGINIVRTLNGVPIATGYQTLDEDLKASKLYFQTLHGKEVNIQGDIKGTSKLNGIELSAFLTRGNSTEFTEKSRRIFLNELELIEGLRVDEIHGLNAGSLYEFLANVDSLPEMVLDGKIHVDRVTVSGDVQVNKLNGHSFDDDIQLTAIWLNRPNYLSTNLKFIDSIDIQGPLNVLGDYNSLNLPDLIEDLVFHNTNGTVLILAPKRFARHVQVLSNTQLDALNGVPFKHYANLRRPTTFDGSVEVNGNLIVKKLAVERLIDGYPIQELTKQIRFDQHLQAFVLRGVTNLQTPLPQDLEDLTVYGDLNNFKQLRKFFENLVYKKHGSLLFGHYNFTGRVTIEGGAYIGNLNGHKLLELFNNIVFINRLEQLVIDSSVHFAAPVKTSSLNVQGTLTANTLNGCDIRRWLTDTVNVRNSETIMNHMHFAPGSLHGNSFDISYLNNIDLSKIITLHSAQNLTDSLRFSEIHLDGVIEVGGAVNGIDLRKEFENTLLTTGNQRIQAPLNLPTVNVLKNLKTQGPINGDKDLAEVATLNGNSEFESPFFFEEIRARNVFTEDLISGINFTDWYRTALRAEGRSEHRINGNWSVGSLKILRNGPSSHMLGSPRAITGDRNFYELCQELKRIFARHSRRSYALKYITKSFEFDLENLTESQDIHKAFIVKRYLFINIGCTTTVFKWNSMEKIYEKLWNFESGMINQLVLVTDNTTNADNFKFMSNSHWDIVENCTLSGQNLWKLKKAKIMHLKAFNENVTELWAAGSKGHIFVITDGGVKKISTSIPYAIESLNLSSTETSDNKFSSQQENSNFLYDNGTHIALVSQHSYVNVQRPRRAAHQFTENLSTSLSSPSAVDDSVLRPNATLVHTLTYADFSHIVERILEDLDYRLGIEIDVTQLIMPESDLYDQHLIEDFIGIIEELRNQQIYPTDMFINVNTKHLEIPQNPAQVLAARTVQIIWPVIVEIDEIHQQLRGNATTMIHPARDCILNYLGLAINDVLSLAWRPKPMENNKSFDETAAFNAVIHRIMEFQKELKELITELQIEIVEDMDHSNSVENEVLVDYKVEDEKMLDKNNRSFSSKKYSQDFESERNELINVEVGAERSPYNFMAVTYGQSQQTPGHPGGIQIYTDVLRNDLFQFIPAKRPRSLTTLRVRDITLLAYVENCCTMIVLQYHGVEGFVNFAKYTSKIPINQLMAINLTHDDYGQRHYIVTVLARKLVFYEVTFAGLKEATTAAAARLNCES